MARLKRNRRATASSRRFESRNQMRRRWNRGLLLGSTGLGSVLAGLALGAGSAWAQVGPNTLPSGGQVVAGSATINQANPNTLNINQSTNRAVINWNSFDVGSNASVNFYQPNAGAWTLNRVSNSVAPSQILGHLTANGNVAVINSNGVIFGAGSRVDVNGLIATTANITDQNFMNGTMKFDQAGNPQAVIANFGDITVKDAGLVAFVAPGVSNAGTITARLGTVSLAAGQRFTIDLYGDKLVSIATDGAVDQRPIGPDGKPVDSLIDNSGRIIADGGQVQLTARQATRIVDNAVNMSGVVQAQSAFVDKNGDIVLDGGAGGDVKVTGTLDASGKNAGTKGGKITVTGKDTVTIGGTAKLDASGDAGGGTIKIGGDFQGKGTTPTATKTTVVSGAQINANAVNAGNGGQVVVWSDDTTSFSGNISARGGVVSGDGGSVEISGKNLALFGASVDTRAPRGKIGSLLLDPTSVDIVGGADDAVTTGGTITDGTLNNLLGGADVTVMTSVAGTGSGNGVINVQSGVVLTLGGQQLTLIADDNAATNVANGTINIASTVSISGGTLQLQAGTVHLSSDIAAAISNAGTNAPSQVFIDTTSASIQEGIDIAGSGATVHVSAGIFDGNLVIGQALTLDGAGVTTVIRPGASSTLGTISGDSGSEGGTSSNNLITINAGNVTISNVKLDGDNIGITTGLVINGAGADVDVRNGIMVGFGGGVSNVTVNAVEVTNFYKRGVQFSSGTGNLIQNSTVNWGEETNSSIGIFFFTASGNATNNHLDHAGITANQTTNWTASGNTLTNSLGGIHTDNGSGAQVISGNSVGLLPGGYGVWAFVPQAGSMVTISGNTVTGGAVGAAVLGGNATANVTLDNNSISGSSDAGIYITNQASTFDTFDTNATLTNNKVTLTALGAVGIVIEDVSGGAHFTSVQIGAGNVVASATIGLQISGARTMLVGNTLNDLVLGTSNGAITGNYVELLLGALDNTLIDGRGATYNNVLGGTANQARTSAIEAKITDVAEDAGVGDIVVNNRLITVDGGGLQAVQDGLDYGAGAHVVVATGTYGGAIASSHSVDGALTIWADDVILQGSGAPQIDASSLSGANAVVISGARAQFAGFAVANTADITSAVVLVSGADALVSDNTITADNSSIHGVLVQASGATLDANSIAGPGAAGSGNGIFVDSGAATLSGVVISNNTVSGFGHDGILVDPVFGPTVIDNDVFNVGGNGIEVDSAAGNVTILRNTVNATGAHAIYVHDTTGTIGNTMSIARNTIGNDNSRGSFGGGNIGGDGINLSDNATYLGDIVVSNNRIGIDTGAVPGAVTPGTIAGSGIAVATVGGNLSIFTNTVSSTGNKGISVQSALGVTVQTNIVDNAGSDGIYVIDSSAVVIKRNTIASTLGSTIGGDGIHFSGVADIDVDRNVIGYDVADAAVAITGSGINGLGGTNQTITNNTIGGGATHDTQIGGYGILSASAANSRIAGNDIRNVGLVDSAAGGINWAGTNGTIVNNMVVNFASDGIVASNGTSLLIDGNIVTGPGVSGIFASGNTDLTITDNTISGVSAAGISVSGFDILQIGRLNHGNFIDNVGGVGIAVSDTSGGRVKVLNNSISNTTLSGIEIASSSLTGVTIDSNTLDAIGASGIAFFSNVARDVSVTNNLVSHTTLSGVRVESSTLRNLSVSGNTVDFTGDSGILVRTIAASASGGAVSIDANVIGSLGTIGNAVGDNGISAGSFTGFDLFITNNEIGQGARIFYSGISYGTVFANGFGGGSATLSGNTIDRVGHHGLEGGNVTNNIVVDSNFIGTTGTIGVLGGDTDGINTGTAVNVTISNNVVGNAMVRNLGDDGIVTANVTGVAVVTGNVVQRARDSGIIFGGNGAVSITGNEINGSGGAGILVVGSVGTIGNVYVGQNTVTGAAGTSGSSSGDGIQVTGNFPATLPFQITGNVTIDGNIINNVARRGVSVFGVTGGVSVTGNTIGNNSAAGNIGTNAIHIDSQGTLTNAGGVLVSGNLIGVATDGMGGLSPATIGDSAIRVSNRTASVTVSGNTLGSFTNHGVLLLNLTGDSTVGSNLITGGQFGVAVRGNSAGTASIDGNTISGAAQVGIEIVNDDGSGGLDTAAELSGNGITSSAIGIRITDNTGGTHSITVQIGTGNTIDGGATGLQISGPGVTLVGSTLSDIVFTGQSGNYVELLNGAVDNQLIDGRGATYDGVLGSAADPDQVTAIELKIVDVADDAGVGDVVINNSLINIDGGTLQLIQDALDYGDNAHVFVATGTYGGMINSAHSPDGALTLWADDVILQGSGAPQLDFSSVMAGSGVVISGARATFAGFGLVNTGFDVSVVLVTGVDASVTGNSITASNSVIDGIRVQASGAFIDGNTIVGPGNVGTGNGIFVDSGMTTLTGIVLSNNSIAGFGNDGILVDPVFNASVFNNDISNVGANGIEVTNSVGDLTIQSNTVNATGANAIYVHDASGTATDTISIDGNTIGNDDTLGNIGSNGILVDNVSSGFLGNIVVTDNSIAIDTDGAMGPLVAAQITNSGIDIENAIGTVSISGNAIGSDTNGPVGHVGQKGIWVNFASGAVDIGDNVAHNTSQSIIEVNQASISVNIHGNTATGSLDHGIGVTNSSTVTISGNTIDNVSLDGIQANSITGGLTINGNLIATSGTIGQNGIAFNGGDSVQVVGNSIGYDSPGAVVVVTGDGIVGTGFTTALVDGNTIGGGTTNDSQIGGNGITISGSSTVTGNLVRNVGYNDATADGIKVGNGTTFIVSGNNIFNVANNGIEAGSGSSFLIAGNTIDNNHDARVGAIGSGIAADSGGAVTITGNDISDVAEAGVSVSNFGTAIVGLSAMGNTIANADGRGVHLLNNGGSTVQANTIGTTPLGVEIDGGGPALISLNSISVTGSTTAIGITIGNTSAPMQILFNDVTGASAGIGIDTADGQFTIQNNNVTGFATGLHVATGTAVTANNKVFDNNFSGNTIGVDHEGTGVIQASGNYWGFTTDDAMFQAYFVNNAALGIGTGMIDVTPFLKDGTDGNGAAVGFIGNFHNLFVTALGSQLNGAGTVVTNGRVQEAVDLIPAGAGVNSIEIGQGTFLDNVVINRPDITNLDLFGQGQGLTVLDGFDDALAVINVMAIDTSTTDILKLRSFDVTGTTGGMADGIVNNGVSNIVISDVHAFNLTNAIGFHFIGGSNITLTDFSVGPGIGKDGVSLSGVTDGTVTNGSIDGTGRDGIDAVDVTGLVVQGNTIGAESITPSIGGRGIDISNSSFGSSLSGNTVTSATRDGIRVRDTGGALLIDGNTVGSTVNGDGIRVARSAEGVTVSGNVIGTTDVVANIAATINGAGIFVRDTTGAVVVSSNQIAAGQGAVVATDGIRVQGTNGGDVTVDHNTIGRFNSVFSIGGDGIQVIDTGLVGGGNVFVLSNSITAVVRNGVLVDPTIGDVTVNGQNILNAGLNGIRVFQTTGKVIVGADAATGNTINATGRNGILVDQTGEVPGMPDPIVGTGGVTVSGNTLGNLAGTTIGTAGTFDAIQVIDTTHGGVLVSLNTIASGNNVVVTRHGVHVLNTTSDGVVTVSGNTIGSSLASVMEDGVRVAGTTGDVTVDTNIVQHVGGYGVLVNDTGGAVLVDANVVDFIAKDAIRVASTGNGVVVSGNSVATANDSTIDGNGITVVDTSAGGVTIGGNLVGTGSSPLIGGHGVLVDGTNDGVTVSGNSIDTGASGELMGDGVRIRNTTTGNVTVLANVLGNADVQAPMDGINIFNTVAGAVSVNGNTVLNFAGFGIHVAQTYGLVTVGGGTASGNTVNSTGKDSIRVNDSGFGGGPGGVFVAGNVVGDQSDIGMSGIVVADTLNGDVTVSDNQVGSGAKIHGDGIRINNTSLGGVTLGNNTVGGASMLAGVDNDGIQVSNTGLGVVLDGNSVTNVGFVSGNGRGIVVNITGLQGIGDISILNSTVTNTGGVGILAQSIGGNVLANSGSIGNAGDTGLRVNYATGVSITGFTIDGSGHHGVHLRNITTGNIANTTITDSTDDGLRLSRTDTLSPSMSVTVGSVTIDGAGGAGLRLFDNDGTIGGGTIALAVGAGVSIANAAIGLIVDGADTRNIGKTLNDMAFTNIGGGTGDYIRLQNAGWYEDGGPANGPFNPTQIDATNVSFDGMVAGSLNPAINPGDVTMLANIETHIFHFLDDPTLGLIRIQATSITLPTANGLNGIQLADYVSANGDSIYLVAGTYGDPSDLVPDGLKIDKQIKLVGWQHGVSAKSGGRDGTTNESILDFAGASSAPTAGIVIVESNVTIDGVAVLLDGSAINGGIVVDTSVARSNIAIVNNFVHGTAGTFASGSGILTSGADTVTGLNVSDNAVEFVNGTGIFVNHGRNLTIQNNQVGNAAFGANNVLGNGIAIGNSSFATPVSGNMLNWVTGVGITIDTVIGGLAVNSNALAHIGGNGIAVVNGNGLTINGNTLSIIAATGISAVSVGNTTIGNNSLANVGGYGIFINVAADVAVNGNALSTVTDNGIYALSVGNTTIDDNSLANVGGYGIFINVAADVAVNGNALSTVTDNGIYALSVGNTTIDDNSLMSIGNSGIFVNFADEVSIDRNTLSGITNSGIYALSVGNTTIDDNSLTSIGNHGIFVEVAGDVSIDRNTLSSISNTGIFALSVGSTTIANNDLDNVTGVGIFANNTADLRILGNTLTTIGGVGIDAVVTGNVTIASNTLRQVTGPGIVAINGLAVSVTGNSLDGIGANGIDVSFVGATLIEQNTLANVTAAGIHAASINGDLRVLGNSLDGIGVNGIEVSTVFGDASVSNNTLHNVTATGITTTNTGNVAVNGNSLDLIGASGIVISTATSNAVVQDNTLGQVGANGIVVGQLTDATIAGNVLSSITGTGIAAAQIVNATVTGNSLSDIGQDGINLSQANDLVVGANQMARIAGDGIDIAIVQNVTVVGNILTDTGRDAGNAGVRLDNYTTATIIGNSIVNLTATTGLAISNGASVPFPQGNTTIAGNIISGNLVGIQTAGDVLGTISGNTITNNSQWGIIVGTGITQTHMAESFTFVNLLVTGNLIANNGVPLDHTLATGGVRNDNIGLVLDARGNDWGDPSGPYAGPSHFNRPNPGGLGNAVGDWVLYDIPVTPTVPPIVPPFGSLLDSFERGGGHPHTPGDVLAIGPSFTYNGALFEPYFLDLFSATFALAEAQGGGNSAIAYALCYLGDMWNADACQAVPGAPKP
ncbi:MAG: right-handed parallel beta-helix repeat-containing protein [Rhodospirillales bacterium]